MTEPRTEKPDQSQRRKRVILLILLLALILSFFVGIQELISGRNGFFDLFRTPTDSTSSNGSMSVNDSLEQRRLDSLAREQVRLDSLLRHQEMLDSLKRLADSLASVTYGTDSLSRARFVRDSIAKAGVQNQQSRLDSLSREQKRLHLLDSLSRSKYLADSLTRHNRDLDSLKMLTSKKDTIAPWIYPDPSGGLHYSAVKISFVTSEPCSVFFRISSESSFKLWDKISIPLSSSEELFYYGVDLAGNKSEIKSKKYVFEKDPTAGSCPEGMVLVTSPSGGFCIDKYEWPNKKGAKPISNVSFSEASDSCFSKGKRLCSSDEWETACEGKYNWSFPYGSSYDPHSCVTQEASRKKSGEYGECRGWYAVYDMVGNLAEWTATQASQDKRFNIVKGGFWESGKGADCRVERYSYYPQNRHNPVGFRCCRDSGNK